MSQLTRATDGDAIDETALDVALGVLEGSQMTMDLLRSTGVGKVVNKIRKGGSSLAPRAKTLVEAWKALAGQ